MELSVLNNKGKETKGEKRLFKNYPNLIKI